MAFVVRSSGAVRKLSFLFLVLTCLVGSELRGRAYVNGGCWDYDPVACPDCHDTCTVVTDDVGEGDPMAMVGALRSMCDGMCGVGGYSVFDFYTFESDASPSGLGFYGWCSCDNISQPPN
jgi:hypothetical protein